MQGISKRIFFWVLTALFFIITPLIIFYSLGYRFNSQRGIFVFTGSLSIKSNPLNVEIYIDQELKNGSLNRINSTYHVGGLKPGDHLIEVKAEGYNTWSKKITVNSGTSTEFWNILLAKNDYARTNYPSDGIDKFFFDPGKKLIAYTHNDTGNLTVSVLDLSNDESSDIFSSDEYTFTSDKKENIEWSPQSKKIIIPVEKEGKKNYFLVDVKTKEIIDLKDIANTEDISKVRWDKDNKNFIYYISDGDIYYINSLNPEEKKIVAKNVASYDLSSGYVYYFQLPSGIVYRTNYNGVDEPEQMTTSAPEKMSDPDYQITVYDPIRIALLNKSGDLYIHNLGVIKDYFKNLSSGISEIQFSDDGKKMLYWSDSEICVYFLRDWEVQPWRNENDQKEVIRFSEKIDNIQWEKDYEHVVFSVGNKIKTSEIDSRSQNNTQDVVSLSGNSSKIVSDFGENKVYFTDIDNGTSKLYSIDFPEKTGILGF
jgi:hypothetical protein